MTYHRNRISRRRRAARYWQGRIDRSRHDLRQARRLFREGKWMVEWFTACELADDARADIVRARKRGRS